MMINATYAFINSPVLLSQRYGCASISRQGRQQTSRIAGLTPARRSRARPLCMCSTATESGDGSTVPTPPAPEATSSTLSSTPSTVGPVFVAGATGRTGQRIVRLLTEAGISVYAGCRSEAKLKSQITSDLVTFVPYDALSKSYYPAQLAESQVVVSALGATEALNLTQFAKIDGFAVKRLMEHSAALPNIRQLIMVTSIGTGNLFAFPAAILNLFGGVLIWKNYAERATIRAARAAENVSYFFVRPGGLERQGDDFGDTHNVKLLPRGSLGGGVVSRLQVAQVVVAAVLNPDAAPNTTVEVVAEKTAPKVDLKTLLTNVPADPKLS